MFLNIEIRRFEEELIKVVETSTIPVEVKRLVVRDVLNQLEIASVEVMKIEMKKGETDGVRKNEMG